LAIPDTDGAITELLGLLEDSRKGKEEATEEA
jgi:hypothetical protein